MELKDIYDSFVKSLIRIYKEFRIYRDIAHYSAEGYFNELSSTIFKRGNIMHLEHYIFVGQKIRALFSKLERNEKNKLNSLINNLCIKYWALYAKTFLEKENVLDKFLLYLKSNNTNDDFFKPFNSIDDYIINLDERHCIIEDFIFNSFDFYKTKEGVEFWYKTSEKFINSIIECTSNIIPNDEN